MIIVTGAAFSGKGRFARAEIERRERDGDLGLVLIDYTALYLALVPGVQSSYRDDRVSATGVSRLIGYLYEVAIREALDRELDGYATTNSPRRALALADRLDALRSSKCRRTEVELADRTKTHLDAIKPAPCHRARGEKPESSPDGRNAPRRSWLLPGELTPSPARLAGCDARARRQGCEV